MSGHASGARTESIFDTARRAVAIEDLAERAGIKLTRAGREQRGPCPICGAGSKSKSQPFAVQPDRGTFRTYCGCDLHGDVVDLERALGGGSLLEAAQRLVGGEYRSAQRAPIERKREPEGPSASDKVALELWSGSRPFEGSLGAKYLAARGIDPTVIARAAPNLRFHPRAKWGWDTEAGDWIKLPAMLVRPMTPSGPTGGVHATYLAPDGRTKTSHRPAKRMWGPQHDSQGRPGGAWLIGPFGSGDLVSGEGIETVLSLATFALRKGRHVRACAALSLNRLQGGVVRDKDGAMDVFDPQPDPNVPAFTWPAPIGQEWPLVLIGIDGDMSEVKVRGRTGRGRVCLFNLTSQARARLCARLAKAAWLKAGAAAVRAVQPPPGSDWNDELQRLLARECGA